MSFSAIFFTHLAWISPLDGAAWVVALVLAGWVWATRQRAQGLTALAMMDVLRAGARRPLPEAMDALDMGRRVVSIPACIGAIAATLALVCVGPTAIGAAINHGVISTGLMQILAVAFAVTGILAAVQAKRILSTFDGHGITAAGAQGLLAVSACAAGLAIGPLAIVLAVLDSSPALSMSAARILKTA